MNAEEVELLLRLAGAIADDIPIRWEEVLADHPALGSRLERLQSMQSMARAYRRRRPAAATPRPSSPPPPSPPPPNRPPRA